jgi:hypothetical protein
MTVISEMEHLMERNNWVFQGIDPTFASCKAAGFQKEFALMFHTSKRKYFPSIEPWLESIS